MIYDVEVNGRTRRLEILKRGKTFEVSVDGRKQAADIAVVNDIWSLILSDVDNGEAGSEDAAVARRSHEIAIVEHQATGDLSVHVNGRLITVTVSGARPAWTRRGQDAAGSGKGPAKVVAPMPGKVVKVLVKPGDAVAARQGVVVVEAMKMENELRSPKAGTVVEVRATEGTSVEAGATLVVIE